MRTLATVTYSGTAREQWALAGIDLSLGRITAEDLHALGEELFRDLAERESKEMRELRKDVERAEDYQRDAEIAAEVLEGKLDKLKDEFEELKAERNRLKRELEGET